MVRFPKCFAVALALTLFVGLAAPALAASVIKGTIKTVSADQNQFVLRDTDDKDWTFQCKADCKIICPAKDSRDVNREDAPKLTDLKVGDPISVLFEKQGDRLSAVAILSNQGANRDAHLVMGMVKRVVGANEPLVMTDGDGKEWTFRVVDDAKVRINGKADNKINALKTGDDVFVVYEKKGEVFMVKEICSDRKPDPRE